MAHASGTAAKGFLPGQLNHEPSGVLYRMEEEAGRVYLSFERKSDSEELKGRRELKYFLGSGRRGRTYLFEQEGYWFEAPINWYAKKRVWDMAPGYLKSTEAPLTLAVDPSCLRCHTTGAAANLPQARNKYAGEPFAQGGIGCTACHGDATAHVASDGARPMLRIGSLAPVRRDSVCLVCHLEGQVMVVHRGKRLVDFKPGDNLFDYASYFVRDGTGHENGERATSQWEALLESGCRRGAGERLTCTSCHDPHGSVNSEGRVGYYRARCLACHEGSATPGKSSQAAFGERHHPENPDCVGCHMPRAQAEDIAHEQVTDHRIPRIAKVPSNGKAKVTNGAGSQTGALVVVADGTQTGSETGDRELGLAYAQLAARGDWKAGEEARRHLRKAADMSNEADDQKLDDQKFDDQTFDDQEVHAQLGFLAQVAGEAGVAEREYGLALALDGEDAFVAGNLALARVKERRYGEAVALWERAFANDPVEVKAGMNLATVECGLGHKEAALGTLERVLEFAPDNGAARKLAREIRAQGQSCGKR